MKSTSISLPINDLLRETVSGSNLSEERVISRKQVTERDLAWLAGIWDGEGTITIYRIQNSGLGVDVSIGNTNEAIINEVLRIFDLLELPIYCKYYEPTKKQKGVYKCASRSQAAVKKFCELMEPYLIGKKEQARLVFRYLSKRLDRKDWHGHDEENFEMQKQVAFLNRKGPDFSETTRVTPDSGEDIVH